jgi:DNA helicase-2/ATP-dependent DNA helicase PcrA
MRYEKNIIGTGRNGPPPKTCTAPDQNREAAAIASVIKKQHEQGADYSQFAVLYRVNMQSRALVDAFLHANIPFTVKDESPVIYEHWIARDLFAFLRLGMRIPAEYEPDAERVMNKPYRFIGKAFLQSAKLKKVSPFRIYQRDPALNDLQRARIDELLFYLQQAGKRKPVDAVRYIRQAAGYNQHIRDYCEYRRLEPAGLYEIADELQEAAKQFDTAGDFIRNAEEVIQAAKRNKTPPVSGVTLSTLHSAKGLEFDTVFIAGAVESVIPHERSKTDAELEEERRLLYVGVTRAKNHLYIYIPKTRYDKEMKPSRFLETERSSHHAAGV